MTDITDQDRQVAHEWATTIGKQIAGHPDARTAARVILATVDAPPRTLAEELRDVADNYNYGMSSRAAERVDDIADRVEHELAEARAEVERLTARNAWPKTTPSGHTYNKPTKYGELRYQCANAAQAASEGWDDAERPPQPTWEMVGIATDEVEHLCDLTMARIHERDEARDEVERVRAIVDPEGAGLPPGMTISEAVQTLVDGIPTGEHEGLTAEQWKREYDRTRAEVEQAEDRAAAWQGIAQRDYAKVELLTADLAEARAEVDHLRRDLAEAYKTRDARDDEVDSLRAEVERLTTERETNTETHTHTHTETHSDNAVTDPADVKPGEAWIVECCGEKYTAVKDKADPVPWNAVTAEGRLYTMRDTDVTIVSRLVPAPRVITSADDLDRLAEGAVIFSVSTQYALQHGDDGDGWYCPATRGKATSTEVLSCGPVTVLWEPGA